MKQGSIEKVDPAGELFSLLFFQSQMARKDHFNSGKMIFISLHFFECFFSSPATWLVESQFSDQELNTMTLCVRSAALTIGLPEKSNRGLFSRRGWFSPECFGWPQLALCSCQLFLRSPRQNTTSPLHRVTVSMLPAPGHPHLSPCSALKPLRNSALLCFALGSLLS